MRYIAIKTEALLLTTAAHPYLLAAVGTEATFLALFVNWAVTRAGGQGSLLPPPCPPSVPLPARSLGGGPGLPGEHPGGGRELEIRQAAEGDGLAPVVTFAPSSDKDKFTVSKSDLSLQSVL